MKIFKNYHILSYNNTAATFCVCLFSVLCCATRLSVVLASQMVDAIFSAGASAFASASAAARRLARYAAAFAADAASTAASSTTGASSSGFAMRALCLAVAPWYHPRDAYE